MAENWYVILELEFDPNPVEDEAIIAQRIEEKRKFWSKNANSPTKGSKYRKYSQKLDQIKRDMIGEDNIRKELIKAACEEVYSPIDKILKQIRKSEIPLDIIEKIAKKQKVDVEIVKRRAKHLGIRIGESTGKDSKKLYDKYYKTKPKDADKYNGMKVLLETFNVSDLYEFLFPNEREKSKLTCDKLRQRIEEKKKNEFDKTDSISGTGLKICAYCEDTFKNASTKKAYDEYIGYVKRKEVLDDLKSIYKMIGEISRELYDDYIRRLTAVFIEIDLAEDVLIAFCDIEKILLPITESTKESKNKNIKVCRCGVINDISDGRRVCKSCGLDLSIKCPNCSSVNDSNIKVCKCGFKFENIGKAICLCDLASEAIDRMDFNIARAHLDDAGKCWPKSPMVIELKSRLAEKEKRLGSLVADMRKACDEKKYYTAKKHYENIKKFSPDYSDLSFEDEINSHIKEAERYKKTALNSPNELDIINACTKAYEAAVDCPGIRAIVSKYRPDKPSNLVVSAGSSTKANIIKWSKSRTEGLLYYSVVRKEGAVPISLEDGHLVGRVSTLTITDKNIVAGAKYYYSVFAERAGVYSDPLNSTAPSINLFEITGLNVVAGDSSLSLSWNRIPENARVEIEREFRGKKEKLVCNSRENYIDKSLINDQEYIYRVYLAYNIDGKKYLNSGVQLRAIPTKPPAPIDKLKVKFIENNEFSIEWENPENAELRFYYSETRPEFLYGDVVSLSLLESKMKSLLVQKVGRNSGKFNYSGSEHIYILAAVIKASSASLGVLARASKGGSVKIKTATLVNDKILISVDPPKDASGFVVLFRTDRFPADISDRESTRKYIPRKQYDYDSGLLIDSAIKQNYYFSVFAEFRIDGEKEYSGGSDYLFANAAKEIITYSVSVNKRLFGANTVELSFESENDKFNFPDVDIMSAVGVVPMFKKSAKLFYQIEGGTVSSPYKVSIPLEKGLQRDVHIKAFLKNEALKDMYQLKLKVNSKLKIS